MAEQYFNIAVLTGLLAITIRLAAPIILAAVANLIPALAGIVDMSTEGVMAIGALTGFLIAHQTGSLWLGILISGFAGLIFSLLSSLLIVVLKMRHSVAGIGENIFAAGISFYIYRLIIGSSGGDIPHIELFKRVNLPLLSDIPLVGVFFSQHLLTYLILLFVVLIWVLLFKTKFGLILRATGEEPRSVDTKGINVSLVHFSALSVAGLFYGIAGSFLPLVSSGIYVPGMIAGRGWIAVTLVVFGSYRPFPIAIGALFFGFLMAIQLQAQAIGMNIPHQLLLALPFSATIFALLFRKDTNKNEPDHIGKPYFRE